MVKECKGSAGSTCEYIKGDQQITKLVMNKPFRALRRIVSFLAALALVGHSELSQAAMLPGPYGNEAAGTVTSQMLGTVSDGTASATAGPGIATASSSGSDTASAESGYYFSINISGSTTPVLIDIVGAASASGVGYAEAYGSFNGQNFAIACSFVSGCPTTTTTQFTVLPNSQLSIALDAIADGSSHSSADPYIYVDPSVPNASAYAVQVSAGVNNTPVPLPASAWLMISGVVGIGAMPRRRRAA
jgi:hypothetical protein